MIRFTDELRLKIAAGGTNRLAVLLNGKPVGASGFTIADVNDGALHGSVS
jgi:hypothetical protein